jgi:hypothetical protein
MMAIRIARRSRVILAPQKVNPVFEEYRTVLTSQIGIGKTYAR